MVLKSFDAVKIVCKNQYIFQSCVAFKLIVLKTYIYAMSAELLIFCW